VLHLFDGFVVGLFAQLPVAIGLIHPRVQEVLIYGRQLVRQDFVELLDDVRIALHRALLRCDEAPVGAGHPAASNAIGDLRQAATAARLAPVMSEHRFRTLRAGSDGLIDLVASHAVTIADVHSALL
jgi:hypothetical protein